MLQSKNVVGRKAQQQTLAQEHRRLPDPIYTTTHHNVYSNYPSRPIGEEGRARNHGIGEGRWYNLPSCAERLAVADTRLPRLSADTTDSNLRYSKSSQA